MLQRRKILLIRSVSFSLASDATSSPISKLRLSTKRNKTREGFDMYCQSCGVAIAQPMKYCNRCGAVQTMPNETAHSAGAEKRLDSYLDGLFWITVFGVALTVGGMVVLKKLQFSDAFIVAFLVLSSSAFLINLALNLRVILTILKNPNQAKPLAVSQGLGTSELEEMKTPELLQPAPSVVENTTRSFEPVRNKTFEGWAKRYRMKDE